MSKILVTGGSGFIGGHLVDRLVKQDHDVVVWDDMSNGMYQNKYARYVLRDITSSTPPSSEQHFDVIFHLAAQIDVRKSVEAPSIDANTNIIGTLKMLEFAKKWDSRFIFTSSGGAVYGEVLSGAADESYPMIPYSPYAVSKRAGEMYTNCYEELYGIETIVLRLGNVYGPRQTGGEAGVIKIFLDTDQPVVYGDGSQKRDYIYVDDVVDAYIAALNIELTWYTPDAYNIGTGVSTSLNTLLKIMGKTATYEDWRIGDLQRSALDVTRARKYLGWTHKTPLQYGIEQMMWKGDDRAAGFR